MEAFPFTAGAKFPKMYRVRHSRMLLAGIQREFRAGPPIKAFGGDDLGAAVRYEPFAKTLSIHASRPAPFFKGGHEEHELNKDKCLNRLRVLPVFRGEIVFLH